MPSLFARPRIVVLLVGLTLAGHGILAIDCARRWTVTHDEYLHFPVGYLTWKTGRFDYDRGSPPLLRLWAAAPLLFTPAVSPPTNVDYDGWEAGDAFLAANPVHYHDWLLLGRAMVVLLSVATGALLARWAWELFGGGSACLTALLWAASPVVLANAPLVTTDLAAAAFFLATVYALWKYACHATWRWAVAFGVCLGLAQLVKFTSLLLFALCPVLWFVCRVRNRGTAGGLPHGPATRRSARSVALQWGAALALSWLLINAGYLFQGSFSPLGNLSFRSQSLARLHARSAALHAFPVPLPRDYVLGIDEQRRVMEGQHPVFLQGELRLNGFRHYYAMAMLYKLPHPLQALILLTLWLLLRGAAKSPVLEWARREPPRSGTPPPPPPGRMLRTQLFLLVPLLVLFAVASAMRMQLGIRYVLALFPFLFLFAGQAARFVDWPHARLRSATLVLLAALLPLGLRWHPHHIAYFNEFAGRPAGGRWHLIDSNLDWGQDLHGLKKYLDAHAISELRLAYFGMFPPQALGISYELPRFEAPAPGWHAVSVNFVQGRPHLVRDGRGHLQHIGTNEFGYFRLFEPAARIGFSIDLYHLDESDVRRLDALARRRADH